MVTELTPNLITLLKSDNVRDNELALVLMGYNESRSDLDKLEDLLDAHGLDVFYFGANKNSSNHFSIGKMIIIQRCKTIVNHEKGNTEST